MFAVVSGGAGFIGSHLVSKLLESEKYLKVVVIDRLSIGGSISNLEIENPKLIFEQADISDLNAMQRIFEKFPFEPIEIYHLAAESHVDRSIKSGIPFVLSNVLGTQVILDCAMQYGVVRVLHVSTDEVYGSLLDGTASENHPLNPSSAYSASKAGSDLLASAAQKTHNLDVIVTRCVNNFGIRQSPEKFIPRMIIRALDGKPLPIYGRGDQIREWISAEDHSDALIKLMNSNPTERIYNIGTADRLSNLQLATEIIKVTKSGSEIVHIEDRKGHDYRYALNSSLLHSEFNWLPTSSVIEQIPKLVEHYAERLRNSGFRTQVQEVEKNYG
ncbi:dTDP-glucose 4,6-dehydratase [Candidatus Planktophila versatilis]|uniref:dTDP-glucose 4,6-dehydratase n=1 Tax=Candidatus Planktophila versatilis TaxID=1884905 RepID=A0ABM6MCT2_9ACTN|nr:GDP-mannose 4,6-dehydratase [Candidatus Planktophila versatilis]ASY16692.1 dTDP-glucose 4,6-dehydratase [Candidatus Planktophila versatilis]